MKITITIEDSQDGSVKIASTPTFEQMARAIAAGHPSTSAEGYALRMIRTAREVSKEQGPTKIFLPRLGR